MKKNIQPAFRLIVLSMICLLTLKVQSQNVYQKMAESTCSCITKQNLKNADKSEFEMAIGLCLLESYNSHKGEMKKSEQVDISNEKEMRSLGEKVGVRMASVCPEVFTNMLQTDEVKSKVEDRIAENNTLVKSRGSVSGKLLSISKEDYYLLKIEAENGSKAELIWFENFEGADKLLENQVKYIGKNVEADYRETEVLLPAVKKHFLQKVVTRIKLSE